MVSLLRFSVVVIHLKLKILLDQVEEAVNDFDECIRLRPDSALAQAQKCFALVSMCNFIVLLKTQGC